MKQNQTLKTDVCIVSRWTGSQHFCRRRPFIFQEFWDHKNNGLLELVEKVFDYSATAPPNLPINSHLIHLNYSEVKCSIADNNNFSTLNNLCETFLETKSGKFMVLLWVWRNWSNIDEQVSLIWKSAWHNLVNG